MASGSRGSVSSNDRKRQPSKGGQVMNGRKSVTVWMVVMALAAATATHAATNT